MAQNKKDDRAKALELTRAQIEKQFGKGSIMLLGEQDLRPARRHFHRQPEAGYRPGHRRPAQR